MSRRALTQSEIDERCKIIAKMELQQKTRPEIADALGLAYSTTSYFTQRYYKEIEGYKGAAASKTPRTKAKIDTGRYMTDEDIRQSYRLAARPKEQIKILAELNLLTVKQVKKILGVKK